MALIPTKTYTILEMIAAWPPKSVATKSNWKIPTNNQFKPPTINRTSAITSSVFMVESPFSLLFLEQLNSSKVN